jgi:DNA polymerase
VIVTLGNFATKFVLNTAIRITRLRGQVHEWHGRTVIPTFHPAAILHGGGERSRQFQLLQDDFTLVREALDGPPATVLVPDAPVTGEAPAPGEMVRLRIVPDPDPEVDQLELF